MSLDPRAITLQGLGFGALLVALQGLAMVTEEAAPAPAPFGTIPGVGVPPSPSWARQAQREDEEILVLVAAALQLLTAG